MEEPLVSVIINTYNHKDYISQAIESVLMQETAFPFEIIIGEDESSDGTRGICVDYAEKYPNKIRLFFRSRKDVIYINGYPTGRRNFIENIKISEGKYVALLPGDDYWTDPLKLQKQVDILENNPEIVVCHHWQKDAIKNNGRFVEMEAPTKGRGYLNQQIATVKDIFQNKLRVKSRTMMFRNILDDNFFPEWFNKVAYGDVPLNFLLGKFGKFYFIDEPMAVYRQTGDGVSKAGLDELGKRKFNILQYKNWIEIWDYADIHFDYEYHREATETVSQFIVKMFINLRPKLFAVFIIIYYNLVRRKLRINKLLASSYLVIRIIVPYSLKISQN